MTAVNDPPATCILDSQALARTIRRLAHEVAEKHPGLDTIVVAAIREGGVPVAEALAAQLEAISGSRVPLLALDVGDYRDDRPRSHSRGPGSMRRLDGEGLPSIDGARVIVVDDVIHTGRTLRAALDLLAWHGRPAAVEPLVLIDRGQREFPIKASFVGKNIPASAQDWVEVIMRTDPAGNGHGSGVFLGRRS